MLSLAAECGVGIPKTWTPASPAELGDLASRIDYPVVVKPRRSAGARGLWYARSGEELRAGYQFDEASGSAAPLIQEYVPGDVHDVCVLFCRGELWAALTQKRIWMYPVTGGRGIVNVTTGEPDHVELACRLMKRMS